MFRSLSGFNYRIWFAGALVSNVGTWMQRTAQDWVVLTILTDNDALAVGVTMALQLGPQLLLVPWTGLIADRFDKRKLLIVTQVTMASLGVLLGIGLLLGVVVLWHVYLFALLLGIASAIDAPARQAFVSELVSEKNLANAVALNSASFNGARLFGPAAAGILTVAVGAGWVFVINAATFAATLIALLLLRKDELRSSPRAPRGSGQLLEGFRYVSKRPDLMVIMVVVMIIGAFGMNFPIFTSTMASIEFNHGASEFGMLSSILAIGSVAGALLAARRDRPRMRMVFVSSALFGVACGLAAIMPTFWTFAVALIPVGFFAISLLTTANATVQSTTSAGMRGRVMALYMAILVGGTPIGAPIVGWVANELGPRWALALGGLAGLVAGLIGLVWMISSQHLRLRYDSSLRGRFYFTHDRQEARDDLAFDETVARKA